MKKTFLVYNHTSEQYEVMKETEYLKTKANVEYILESQSLDYLYYKADVLNGEYQTYDNY